MTRAGHVHLGKLRIRLPGPAGAYGRRIAERALERLSAELPEGLTGEIGRLELKVRVRPGASEAEVEQALVGAMKKSLAQAGVPAPPALTSPAPARRAATTPTHRSEFERSLLRARNAEGERLPAPIREQLERAIPGGVDDVRIHRDAEASKLTEAVGARAFTVGRDVFFRRGEFRPDSPAGTQLIAHEVAHVVQQRQGQERIARWPWSAERPRPHSDDEMSQARVAFTKKNDHLTEAQLRKITSSVTKVASRSRTWEVLWAFYDYYSGFFGQKIELMDPKEAAAARAMDRWAETKPDGDTKLRPDILTFDDTRLGNLLLHELAHTGHHTNVLGAADFEEGHAYAIEYFYAEQSGDKARAATIVQLIDSASVVVPSQAQALKDLFRWSYAVLTSLQTLIKTNRSPYKSLPHLTDDDAELLIAEFITHFREPGDLLRRVIADVKGNLDAYAKPL